MIQKKEGCPLEPTLAVLNSAELLADISPADLRALAQLGIRRTYSRGQCILQPQQKLEQLGILLSGRVHILHLFPGGSYSLMQALEPGDTLGADLVCTRSRLSPYHATADEETHIFWLEAGLITCPGRLPEGLRLKLLDNLLLLISQENMKREYRLAILSRNGLRERILMYLTMQRNRLQKNPFTVTLDREEMAAFLCVNRSALSHELSRMQQEGLLQFRKNEFWLRDAP